MIAENGHMKETEWEGFRVDPHPTFLEVELGLPGEGGRRERKPYPDKSNVPENLSRWNPKFIEEMENGDEIKNSTGRQVVQNLGNIFSSPIVTSSQTQPSLRLCVDRAG
jgi:hypothetical protein